MDARELDALYLEHVRDLRRRFDQVLASQSWDAVVIHSGSPQKRSTFDDQFWPLRPCPPFQHWLPLAEPDCLLIVTAGEEPRLLRPAHVGFWERAPIPESVSFLDALQVFELPESQTRPPIVADGRVAFVGEDPARAAGWGFDEDAHNPPALVRALDALRTTKTAYEVACIAEANRRARAGHEALRRGFQEGRLSELGLHLLYLNATEQDDPETPYKNIVALGPNAATLHHVAYGRRVSDRVAESLLVDAGAACRGYCADITRTWVKGRSTAVGVYTGLIAGVEAMQQRLCAAVRAGESYEALHDESHWQVAAVLRDAGIVRGSADEAVARGVTRAFFPHGLGHSLGLQTHDVGCALRAPRADNPYLRNTSDMAAGQVLTVEPGVYFIEALLAPLREDGRVRGLVDWGLVSVLAPLGGVRIEDDLLVLADGVRNFTREELPIGGGPVD